MKKKLFVTIFLIIVFAIQLMSYTEILKIVPTADVSSRGNTAVAADDTLGSAMFNPACMSKVQTLSFLVSHFEYVENTKYESLLLVKPFNLFKLGFSCGYMYSENIPRTLIDPNQQFGFLHRGSYGNNWLTLAVMLAKQKDSFVFGTGLKFIRENLAGSETYLVGVTLGLLYKLTRNISLGFVLDNITANIEEKNQTEEIPVLAKIGCKFSTEKFVFITEFDCDTNQYYHFKLGSQLKLFNILTINVGYDYHKSVEVLGLLSGLNLGCGIKFYNYKVDYSVGYLDKFGLTHRITLTGEIW